MQQHDWSERRACVALGLSRSTARYRARPDRDEEVIALLAELAERFPERGFDKLFQLIRRRGLELILVFARGGLGSSVAA